LPGRMRVIKKMAVVTMNSVTRASPMRFRTNFPTPKG
jgi:hypothetical protein